MLTPHFDRAVDVCAEEKGLEPDIAFWKTVYQTAWQASSIDFCKVVKNEEYEFALHRNYRLGQVSRFNFIARWSIRAETYSSPWATGEQQVLMRADVREGQTIMAAEDVLRRWKDNNNVTPLQGVLAEGLYRYPKLRVSTDLI